MKACGVGARTAEMTSTADSLLDRVHHGVCAETAAEQPQPEAILHPYAGAEPSAADG